MPYTRPLGGGLFEIRAQGTEGIGRTPKPPVKDLRLARKRLKEVK